MPADAGVFIGRSGRMPRLLRNDTGEIVSAAPARVRFPADENVGRPATRVVDERGFSDAQWAEAARRRDLLAALAGRAARSQADVDAVAKELGSRAGVYGRCCGKLSARSSRLRSFSDVLSAAHSAGTSRASASSCSREGSSVGVACSASSASASASSRSLCLPAGLEAASDEAVLGLAGVERALGTRGVIAGALDAQLDRAGQSARGGRTTSSAAASATAISSGASAASSRRATSSSTHGRLDRPAAPGS